MHAWFRESKLRPDIDYKYFLYYSGNMSFYMDIPYVQFLDSSEGYIYALQADLSGDHITLGMSNHLPAAPELTREQSDIFREKNEKIHISSNFVNKLIIFCDISVWY